MMRKTRTKNLYNTLELWLRKRAKELSAYDVADFEGCFSCSIFTSNDSRSSSTAGSRSNGTETVRIPSLLMRDVMSSVLTASGSLIIRLNSRTAWRSWKRREKKMKGSEIMQTPLNTSYVPRSFPHVSRWQWDGHPRWSSLKSSQIQ